MLSLQRTLPFLDQENPNSDENEADRIKKSLRYFGLPLLVSLESKWTTRRVQYHIWLNLLPFFTTSSAYAQHAFNLLKSKNVTEQLEKADGLPVRIISSDGHAVWSKKISDQEDVLTVASVLGAQVPVDKASKGSIGKYSSKLSFDLQCYVNAAQLM